MARQFADPRARSPRAELLQRLGDLSVRLRPARRSEILVQGVLDERMGEVELPRRVGRLSDQRCRGRRVEHVDQLVGRRRRRSREEIQVEVTADHGREREHALGAPPRRTTRPPITSRTLSGSATSANEPSTAQRPDESW